MEKKNLWIRNEFYLGTWNVLSLYRAGVLRILLIKLKIQDRNHRRYAGPAKEYYRKEITLYFIAVTRDNTCWELVLL